MGQFGDKFRKEREKKNFSLDDVSHVTKIGSRMLQAIEEENFDRLPGGVFNKGFIRAYAKHLGMNDEEAVPAYLACQRQTQIEAQEGWEPAPSAPNRRVSPERRAPGASKKAAQNKVAPHSSASRTQTQTEVEELPGLQLPRAEHVRPPRNKYLNARDTGIPWRIVALAAVVVVLGLVLWIRHSRSPHTEAANASPSTPPPAVQPATTPVLTSQTPPARAPSPTSLTSHASASNALPPSTQPATTLRSLAPVKPIANPATNASANDATTNPSDSANQPPPEKPAPPLTLIIRASENSWISVLADGREVTAETLIAPAHTSVRAAREIVVKTGNAAGVNFLWNGKEVPAQGAEAEVMTFVFDAAGIRTTPTPAQNQ